MKKETWKTAEVVSGRLKDIDRETSTIIIEAKEVDPVEEAQWIYVPRCYDLSDDLSDEDHEKLLNHLGNDIKVKLIDGEITEIMRT